LVVAEAEVEVQEPAPALPPVRVPELGEPGRERARQLQPPAELAQARAQVLRLLAQVPQK